VKVKTLCIIPSVSQIDIDSVILNPLILCAFLVHAFYG